MSRAERRAVRHPALRPKVMALSVAACFGLAPSALLANPTGPTVVGGNVTFSGLGTPNLTVTNSANAIINWQSFSIGAHEITRFVQPSAASAVLNRVVGAGGVVPKSLIDGVLASNGHVFLLNPAGVLIGANATIDVAGLVASSLHLSDEDFLAGRLRFSEVPGAGAVSNSGAITASPGGRVFLVGPEVKNEGVIRADGGQILLAAGKSVELLSENTPFVTVRLTADSEQALNVGTLLSESGRIGMFGALVRNGGIVEASGAVEGPNGQIRLVATKDLHVEAGSRVSASGTEGGKVLLQAENGTNLVAGTVEAKGTAGKGGDVHALGVRVGVIGRGVIDASGETGGGSVLVGGDFQGKNADVQNAQSTYVGRDGVIRADAMKTGDGGRVIVWADGDTRFHGTASARGGSTSGNGGFVETSGKQSLTVTGTVSTSAPNGKGGTWLLDPNKVDIRAGAYGAHPDDAAVSDGILDSTEQTNDPAQVSVGALIHGLQANQSVEVRANEDIEFHTDVDVSSAPGALTFRANRDIHLHGYSIVTRGDLKLLADDDEDQVGSITGNGNIKTHGFDFAAVGTSVSLGSIDTRGDANGVDGGWVRIEATGDMGRITVGSIDASAYGGSGGSGGNVTLVRAGFSDPGLPAVEIPGGIRTHGADGQGDGVNGGAGGRVVIGGDVDAYGELLMEMTGSVVIGDVIDARGGPGADSSSAAGGHGGDGGDVTIYAESITTQSIDARGGDGGATTAQEPNRWAGGGGSGGSVYLSASGPVTVGGSINTAGGAGGNAQASLAGFGGDGGDGGSVHVYSRTQPETGTIEIFGTITTAGGAGGHGGAGFVDEMNEITYYGGDGGWGGGAGHVQLGADASIVVHGSILAYGGAAGDGGDLGGWAGQNGWFKTYGQGGDVGIETFAEDSFIAIEGNIDASGGTGGRGGDGDASLDTRGGGGGTGGNGGEVWIGADRSVLVSGSIYAYGGAAGDGGAVGGHGGHNEEDISGGYYYYGAGGSVEIVVSSDGGSITVGTAGVAGTGDILVHGGAGGRGGDAGSDNLAGWGGAGGRGGYVLLRANHAADHIAIHGSIDARGGDGGAAGAGGEDAYAGDGGHGGIVDIRVVGPLSVQGSIATSGGRGGDAGAPGNYAGRGGGGGLLFVHAEGSINIGGIRASGGDGGTGGTPEFPQGDGGEGGFITLMTGSAEAHVNVPNGIEVRGGNAGSGSGGTGGRGGDVDIFGEWDTGDDAYHMTSVQGTVSVGGIVARGGDGAAGAQYGGHGGDGGVVWIAARDGVSVPGGIDARGGDAAPGAWNYGGRGGEVRIGGDYTIDHLESQEIQSPASGLVAVGDILTRGGLSGLEGMSGGSVLLLSDTGVTTGNIVTHGSNARPDSMYRGGDGGTVLIAGSLGGGLTALAVGGSTTPSVPVAGPVTVNGSIDTHGGDAGTAEEGTTPQNGGRGGSVSIHATGTVDILGSVTTLGGRGGDGGPATAYYAQAGGMGGDGGDFTLTAAAATVAGVIDTSGGRGGDGASGTANDFAGAYGGDGGNAGAVSISAGAMTLGQIRALGGQAGNRGADQGAGTVFDPYAGGTGHGAGGHGGAVDLSASSGDITLNGPIVVGCGLNGDGTACAPTSAEIGSMSITASGSVGILGADNFSLIGATPITAGTFFRWTTAGAPITLSQSFLNSINAPLLVIGDTLQTPEITLAEAISLASRKLSLLASGTIASTYGITADGLNVDAASVSLAGGNAVGMLQGRARSGNFLFLNNGDLSLGTVDAGNAMPGVTASGLVTLVTTGNIASHVTDAFAVSGAGVQLAAPYGAIGSSDVPLEVGTTALEATAGSGIAIELNRFDPTFAAVDTLENTGEGDILLNAHGGAIVNGRVSNPGGDIRMASNTGQLQILAGMTSGGTIELTADGQDGEVLVQGTVDAASAVHLRAAAGLFADADFTTPALSADGEEVMLTGANSVGVLQGRARSGDFVFDSATDTVLGSVHDDLPEPGMTAAGKADIVSAGRITGDAEGAYVIRAAEVVLESEGGAIGSPDAPLQVAAETLDALARDGIAIETNAFSPAPVTVNRLASTGEGDIVLLAHGGAKTTALVENPGGDVLIKTFSPLQVLAGAQAGGAIELETSGDPSNDMVLDGPFTAGEGFKVTVGAGGVLVKGQNFSGVITEQVGGEAPAETVEEILKQILEDAAARKAADEPAGTLDKGIKKVASIESGTSGSVTEEEEKKEKSKKGFDVCRPSS